MKKREDDEVERLDVDLPPSSTYYNSCTPDVVDRKTAAFPEILSD